MQMYRVAVRVPWKSLVKSTVATCLMAVALSVVGGLVLAAAPIHIGKDLLDVTQGASLDAQNLMFYAAIVILIASGIWAWITDHGVMKTLMVALACIIVGGGAAGVATLLVH